MAPAHLPSARSNYRPVEMAGGKWENAQHPDSKSALLAPPRGRSSPSRISTAADDTAGSFLCDRTRASASGITAEISDQRTRARPPVVRILPRRWCAQHGPTTAHRGKSRCPGPTAITRPGLNPLGPPRPVSGAACSLSRPRTSSEKRTRTTAREQTRSSAPVTPSQGELRPHPNARPPGLTRFLPCSTWNTRALPRPFPAFSAPRRRPASAPQPTPNTRLHAHSRPPRGPIRGTSKS